MADTIWQQIVAFILAAIKAKAEITAANVFEWHGSAIPQTNMPGIDIQDSMQTVALTTGSDNRIVTIRITAFATGTGTVAAQTVRNLLGYAEEAVYVDETCGGVAAKIMVADVTIDISHEEKRVVGGTMTLEVETSTVHQQPFTIGF